MIGLEIELSENLAYIRMLPTAIVLNYSVKNIRSNIQHTIHTHHIVPVKHPWVLTAQTPKIECGRLHGGSAWMVQLFLPKHPSGCEVSCQGVPKQLTLSLHPCFVEVSLMVGKAIQSGPTCSLVAKFVACSTWTSCCRQRMLWTRPWTGVQELLMPDVMAPEVH